MGRYSALSGFKTGSKFVQEAVKSIGFMFDEEYAWENFEGNIQPAIEAAETTEQLIGITAEDPYTLNTSGKIVRHKADKLNSSGTDYDLLTMFPVK